VTGGFSGHGVHVHVTHGVLAFCLYVAHNGSISSAKSQWVVRHLTLTERITASGHTITASGVAHGAGHLKGHASSVKLKGAESLKMTFTIEGHQVSKSGSFSVSAPLPISTASAHRVTGDAALKGRTAQQQAGFTSTERAPYAAHPVSHCTP
jgi:hypothetical protein